jgi:hypothetical protein
MADTEMWSKERSWPDRKVRPREWSPPHEGAKTHRSSAIAHAFVEEAIAYFDKPDHIKPDVIAVKQVRALKDLQGPRETPLRLSDVKKMFVEKRKHLRR